MTDSGQLEIRPASSDEDIEAVRGLWREYWEGVRLPSDFQDFAKELSALPSHYAPPKGRLLLACIDGGPAGSAAFRPLIGDSCEAKRLYVRPQFRRLGIAKALLQRLLLEAREEGYAHMYGDTLRSMTSALRLYRDVGFVEVGAYSPDPTPGAIFLKLRL